MNKSIAMKWVKALRSGKFKQGTGRLIEAVAGGDVQYCCLGVLAKTCGFNKDTIQKYATLSASMRVECDLQFRDGSVGDFDDVDMESLKIRVGNHYKYFNNLANANDNGASFRSIATWIEKNYKKL